MSRAREAGDSHNVKGYRPLRGLNFSGSAVLRLAPRLYADTRFAG